MTYTERVCLKNGAIIISMAAVFSLALILDALWIQSSFSVQPTRLIIVGFCLFVGIVLYVVFNKVVDRRLDQIIEKSFNEIKRAEQGEEGEEGVCAELDRILNHDGYTLYRNFKIPFRKFDFDAIVVGSKGLFVLEIKNPTNPMGFTKKLSYYEKNGALIPLSFNRDPRRKLVGYCQALGQYFADRGINKLPMHAAVVFFKNDSAKIFDEGNSVAIVAGANRLADYFSPWPDDPRFAPDVCAKINAILRKHN